MADFHFQSKKVKVENVETTEPILIIDKVIFKICIFELLTGVPKFQGLEKQKEKFSSLNIFRARNFLSLKVVLDFGTSQG